MDLETLEKQNMAVWLNGWIELMKDGRQQEASNMAQDLLNYHLYELQRLMGKPIEPIGHDPDFQLPEPVIIGNAKMYLGDSKKIIPALVAAGMQARCVLMDAPYPLESGGQTEGGLHERLGTDDYNNSGSLVDCLITWPEIMQLAFMALGDQGHCYTMANAKNVGPNYVAAMQAGFRQHNLCYWDKVTMTPNRWYMKNAEFTGFFFKGRAYSINDCTAKQGMTVQQTDESARYAPEQTDKKTGRKVTRAHPTEKPVVLMKHYIEMSTQPGELVVDPFAGSGTTGVAAIRAKRDFIGVEIDEKFFNMACDRLAAAAHIKDYKSRSKNPQTDLFAA